MPLISFYSFLCVYKALVPNQAPELRPVSRLSHDVGPGLSTWQSEYLTLWDYKLNYTKMSSVRK